jgi:hypothetical protein
MTTTNIEYQWLNLISFINLVLIAVESSVKQWVFLEARALEELWAKTGKHVCSN